MELSKLNFEEFSKYLYENYIFGFTARIRKNVIIYTFKRLIYFSRITLKVKVNQKTKQVLSVLYNNKEYTDTEDLKKIIEQWSNHKNGCSI